MPQIPQWTDKAGPRSCGAYIVLWFCTCQRDKRTDHFKDGCSPSTCSGFFRLLIALWLGTAWFRFTYKCHLPWLYYIFRHNAIIHNEADQAAGYLPTLCLKCSVKSLMSLWYSFLCRQFVFPLFFFLYMPLSLLFRIFTVMFLSLNLLSFVGPF